VPETGTVLSGELPRAFGKYLLTRPLGRGAMGAVYEAQDTLLKRQVALKLMVPGTSRDALDAAQEEAYFVREAQVAARLEKHPNIVTIYEAGILEGRRYIAMEHLQAQPLSEWTRERRPSLRARVKILRDVALAVHHAHEGGVLHRDLTPKNVLIDRAGRPYVTDFGMAKRVGSDPGGSSTSAGLVVGTPSYMSPEQAQGLKSIDRRTDVYALGAMLYEMLAGKPPFPGEMTIVALMKVVQDTVPTPSSVSPEWAAATHDKSIETLCMKALAKLPADRPESARAFADALSLWLGESTVARMKRSAAVPPSTAPLGPGRRRLAAAALGLAGLAVLAFLLAPRDAPVLGAPLPPRDLLRHIDPARDGETGTWSRDGTALAGAGSPLARLLVPWRPTPDYDLRAVVVPGPGATEILLYLNREGRSTAVCVDVGPSAKLLCGTAAMEIPGGVAPGTPVAIEVKVRAAGVTASVGGRDLAWATDWPASPLPGDWGPADPTLLAIGVRAGTATFRELRITEYPAAR
jgi:tRNA A-37 threonylcarbamoyl transferase component Bud32